MTVIERIELAAVGIAMLGAIYATPFAIAWLAGAY